MDYKPTFQKIMAERLIYFGGSFDPVHVGHVRIARALAEGVQAGRVLLVPTGVNPLKPAPVAPADDRLAMLKLATRNDELFEISTLELYRTGPCYTVDTIEQLRKQIGSDVEIHLAVGADMLADMPKWRRATDLLGMVRLVVACRPPMAMEAVQKALQNLSTTMEAFGRKKIHAQVVPAPLLEISSSDIRQKLRQGVSVENIIEKEVMEFIFQHQLYGTSITPPKTAG